MSESSFAIALFLFGHIPWALIAIFQRMLDSKHKNYTVWYLPKNKV